MHAIRIVVGCNNNMHNNGTVVGLVNLSYNDYQLPVGTFSARRCRGLGNSLSTVGFFRFW